MRKQNKEKKYIQIKYIIKVKHKRNYKKKRIACAALIVTTTTTTTKIIFNTIFYIERNLTQLQTVK
jgi:hypothetical protein